MLVNLVNNPSNFFTVALIGMTNGLVFGLVALGYTLVYGILQLINFAHGDLFAFSGLVAWTMIISVFGLTPETAVLGLIGGLLVTFLVAMAVRCDDEREHRAGRVPPAATCAEACAADHRRRHVLHHPERRAGDLGRHG